MYTYLIVECLRMASYRAYNDHINCLTTHHPTGKRRSKRESDARFALSITYGNYRKEVREELLSLHNQINDILGNH